MSNKVEVTCKGQIIVMESPFLHKVAFTVVCKKGDTSLENVSHCIIEI